LPQLCKKEAGMKTNMHLADRIVRILLSLTIVILYFTEYLSGTPAIIALVVAIIFTLTSVAGFCPLYALFGISGKKERQ
jgi:hypothetical protein